MPETPQAKTDVQTLLEYFDKLLGTFRALIWIASVAVVIISTIFTILLFKSKDDATVKVLEAEQKAEKAYLRADSLIRKAESSIDETETEAKQGIASVSEVAEREISNLKSIARTRANEEVERYVKSPEIQNIIDAKVRKEIEGSYFQDVSEMSEITSAAIQMAMGEYNGMLALQKYSQRAKNPLSQELASKLLQNNCVKIMERVWSSFPDYSNRPEPYKTAGRDQEFDKKHLQAIESFLSQPNPELLIINRWIHEVNYRYGKTYSVCEIEEMMKFLRN